MHAAIVDPSREFIGPIEKHFTDQGDAVSAFSDAADALAKIKDDDSINMLISRLEFAPLSGLELCWQSRLAVNSRRPLYIAALSSVRNTEKLLQALASGADDLFPEPVSPPILHARLRTVAPSPSLQYEPMNLAEIDTLTELFNRGAFFRRISAVLDEADASEPISAIMLDIDNLKQVNELHGPEAGDTVIRTIAAEARKLNGLTGRIIGEEFAIFLYGAEKAHALQLAEGLRQRCAELVFTGPNGRFQVTCSLGVSQWIAGDAADSLLKRADIALYDSKSRGPNRVSFAERWKAMMPQPKSSIRSGRR